MATTQNVYSANLDGSTDAFSIADHSDFKPTGNFTVGMWLNADTWATTNHFLFQSYSANTNLAGIQIYVSSGGTLYFLSGKNTGTVDGTDYKYASATPATAGTWHFYTFVWDGSNLIIYIDGVNSGSIAWVNAPAYAGTNYIRIGCGNNSGTDANFFDGLMDGVFLINGTALTQAQIATLMYQDLTGVTNLKAYYKFENNANDSSGNSHTLTDIGTPTYDSAADSVPFTYYMEADWDNLTSLDLESTSSQYAYETSASSTGLDMGSGDFTVEAWFKLESTGAYKGIFFNGGGGAGGKRYLLHVTDAEKLEGQIDDDTTAISITGGTTLSVGIWYHGAVVRDGNNLRLYLNGVSDAAAVDITGYGSLDSSDAVTVGAEQTVGNVGNSNPMDGKIDSVRVFNDVRTATEIASDLKTQNVTNANLQAEWDFDGDYLDTTTNNNDLTSSGSPIFSPDPAFDAQGNRRSLDLELSSSQYASITDAAQTGLDITGDISIEAWINLESLPAAGTQASIIQKFLTTGNKRGYLFAVYESAGSYYLNFVLSSDGTYSAGSDTVVAWTPTVGVWYHVAVTWLASGKTAKFYVNTSQQGTDQSTTVGSINDTDTAVQIGYNNANYFDGKIDEIRVWNDVRTPTEIANNYNQILQGDEAGLVGYWRFGNNYVDLTSNKNNLTPVSSPAFSWIVPTGGEFPESTTTTSTTTSSTTSTTTSSTTTTTSSSTTSSSTSSTSTTLSSTTTSSSSTTSSSTTTNTSTSTTTSTTTTSSSSSTSSSSTTTASTLTSSTTSSSTSTSTSSSSTSSSSTTTETTSSTSSTTTSTTSTTSSSSSTTSSSTTTITTSSTSSTSSSTSSSTTTETTSSTSSTTSSTTTTSTTTSSTSSTSSSTSSTSTSSTSSSSTSTTSTTSSTSSSSSTSTSSTTTLPYYDIAPHIDIDAGW